MCSLLLFRDLSHYLFISPLSSFRALRRIERLHSFYRRSLAIFFFSTLNNVRWIQLALILIQFPFQFLADRQSKSHMPKLGSTIAYIGSDGQPFHYRAVYRAVEFESARSASDILDILRSVEKCDLKVKNRNHPKRGLEISSRKAWGWKRKNTTQKGMIRLKNKKEKKSSASIASYSYIYMRTQMTFYRCSSSTRYR